MQSKKPETTAKTSNTEELMKGTEAGRIWDDIKNREILMFALPGQKVHQHVSPVFVEPSKLYLQLHSTAALPSLESAVSVGDPLRKIGSYQVELAGKYVIVSPVPMSVEDQINAIKQ